MGGDSPCSRGGTACTAWSAWLACTSSKAAEVSRDGSIPAGIPPATESTIKYAQHRNEQRSRINNVALKKVRVLKKKKTYYWSRSPIENPDSVGSGIFS